jgi:hypothetical protein
MPTTRRTPRLVRRAAILATAASLLALAAGPASAASVYKWLDESGVVHLSSQKPPHGVKYERLSVARSQAPATHTKSASSRSTATRVSASTPAQAAQRTQVIGALQNRECVVALEALDKLANGGGLVEPAEMRRLEQTANLNCSSDPVRRGEQEQMAARLRVAKGDVCVSARNKLVTMLEPGNRPTREQLKAQQEFIEGHCTAPVR